MGEKLKIYKTKILPCEGIDEYEFLVPYLKHLNIEDVQVIDMGGIKQFKTNFDILWKMNELIDEMQAILLLRDAEEGKVQSAFQSMQNILKLNKIIFPSNIGEISKNSNIKTGIFISPDNSKSGTFEDLILKSFEGTDVEKIIEKNIAEIKCSSLHDKQFNESKSRILTLCSIYSKKGNKGAPNKIGLLVRKNIINLDHPCFDCLKNIVYEIFL